MLFHKETGRSRARDFRAYRNQGLGLILPVKGPSFTHLMDNSGITAPKLPGAPDFQQIVAPLVPAFADLEAYLAGQVASFEPEVQPLVEYCFGHSGKKLRPILVYSMGWNPGEPVSAEITRAAAIVELVHLATLVHDDILDEAEVRHRTETLVNKHGAHVAVLLGDALFAHALHLAAQFPEVEVCRVVSLATRQVCSGEIAQTFSRGGTVPTLDAYYRMIDLKTAELFKVSAYLGGLLAGFSPGQLEAASGFARHLGIAYQIYDDAADIFAEESVAGKTLGTDMATGKFTLPVILWLQEMGQDRHQQEVEKLINGSVDPLELRSSLLRSGILERTGEAFHREISLARQAIEVVPGNNRQQRLSLLAAFVQNAWNKFTIQ